MKSITFLLYRLLRLQVKVTKHSQPPRWLPLLNVLIPLALVIVGILIIKQNFSRQRLSTTQNSVTRFAMPLNWLPVLLALVLLVLIIVGLLIGNQLLVAAAGTTLFFLLSQKPGNSTPHQSS